MPPNIISGEKKKAKKPPKPVKSAISARSTSVAKMLILLSEGEVEGSGGGTLSAQDIYLDEVPIQNPNGEFNYEVKWEFRKGVQNQDYITSLPSVENYRASGLKVEVDRPYITNITNTSVDQVRVNLSFPSLQESTENGDYLSTSVEYAVDIATGSGAYVEQARYTLSGRFVSEYQRTHEFKLDKSTTGWRVRVRRITADAGDNQFLQNDFSVSGITEVIDAKLRYPNTSVLFLEFDAESFTQIPKVSVKMKGRLVRVPENYNPVSKTYSGVWSGMFKWAYSNNPVWCLLDVLLSETYGLGERVKLETVDKWGFYKIAQWCDVKVKDGLGGYEARHSLNVYLQKQVDAWRLVQDICSNFNGNLYWNGVQLEIYADIPTPIEYTYNTSNVVDGKFIDAGIDVKGKYSQVIVSYDDPDNRYNTDKVPVYDIKLNKRFGNRSTEIPAFGVTSRGEAQRKGKWALMANRFDRVSTFSVGLDGYVPRVGALVAIANNRFAGADIGGRIVSVTSKKVVTLDRDCRVSAGDRLVLNLPSGKSETKTIQSVSGRVITVTTNFSEMPQPSLAYSIDSDTLAVQTMRVTSSKQSGDTFTISTIEYNEAKQAYIDEGAYFDIPPISITPTTSQAPPTNPTIYQYDTIDQGINVSHLVLGWTRAKDAVYYDVQWSIGSSDWVNVPRTTSSEVTLDGVYAGLYKFRVRAVSAVEVTSQYVTSLVYNIKGKIGQVQPLAFLETETKVMAIGLKWGFKPRSEDSDKVELQVNLGMDDSGANLLSYVGYPTNSFTHFGLGHDKTLYYRGRVIDKLGNESDWTDWVVGVTSADAGDILDYLDKQIGESQLNDWLTGELDKIDVNDLKVDSIRDDLLLQIANIESKVNELESVEFFDPTATYAKGDIVKYDNAIYSAKSSVPTGTLPTNDVYWDNIGGFETINDIIVALSLQVTELTNQVSVWGDNIVSTAGKVDGIYTTVKPPMAGDTVDNSGSVETKAGVWSIWNAISTETYALSTRLDLLTAQYNDNKALISQESIVRASADNVLAQKISDMRVDFEEDIYAAVQEEASLRANAFAATIDLIERTEARIDGELSVQGNTINDVTNSVVNNGLELSSQAGMINGVLSGLAVVDDKDEASRAAAQTTLEYKGGVGEVIYSITPPPSSKQLPDNFWLDSSGSSVVAKQWNGSSWVIVDNDTTRDMIEAARIANSLAGTKADAGVVNTLSSKVTTQGDQIAAEAIKTTILQSQVGTATSQINTIQTTQANTEDNLNALWGVRMSVNSGGAAVVAGVGLGIEKTAGVYSSQFIVQADLFAVQKTVEGNNTRKTVFAVDSANGSVVMNEAVIGTATIGTAKIKDAAVDTLRIKGNAVTVPTAVETGSGVIPVASVYLDFAGDIMVTTNASFENTGIAVPARAQIQISTNLGAWRDIGTTRFVISGFTAQSQTFTALTAVTSGNHRVRVMISGHESPFPDYNSKVLSSRLILLGVKR